MDYIALLDTLCVNSDAVQGLYIAKKNMFSQWFSMEMFVSERKRANVAFMWNLEQNSYHGYYI